MFINYLRFFIEYHNFITLVVFVICVWTNKAVFATMSWAALMPRLSRIQGEQSMSVESITHCPDLFNFNTSGLKEVVNCIKVHKNKLDKCKKKMQKDFTTHLKTWTIHTRQFDFHTKLREMGFHGCGPSTGLLPVTHSQHTSIYTAHLLTKHLLTAHLLITHLLTAHLFLAHLLTAHICLAEESDGLCVDAAAVRF